jgi:hypothetical protein
MQNEPLINANLYLLKSYVQMRFILGKAGVDNKAGAIIEFCAGQKDQVVVGKQFRAACSLRTSIKGIPARSQAYIKRIETVAVQRCRERDVSSLELSLQPVNQLLSFVFLPIGFDCFAWGEVSRWPGNVTAWSMLSGPVPKRTLALRRARAGQSISKPPLTSRISPVI